MPRDDGRPDPGPPCDDGLAGFLQRQLGAREFIERRSISNVTILLTYRCPAACGHCVFRCDSRRTDAVEAETARRFVDAAARQQPPPALSFSGGEPFLRLPLVEELAARAWSHGMPSEIISSSVWCRNAAQAEAVLGRLRERGLRTYCTSVDRFHTPHVPPERMRTAVLAALDVGLRVVLNTIVDPRGVGQERRYLRDTLGLAEEALERCRINPILAAPVGRARESVDELVYKDKDFREGCPFATEIVTLAPDGRVYPCCGMVLGEGAGVTDLFVAGELGGRDVDAVAEVLEALKDDLFFRLVQVLGPFRLLQEIRHRRPSLRTRTRFTGSCDVCLEFARVPELAAATWELLDECAAQLAPVAECA